MAVSSLSNRGSWFRATDRRKPIKIGLIVLAICAFVLFERISQAVGRVRSPEIEDQLESKHPLSSNSAIEYEAPVLRDIMNLDYLQRLLVERFPMNDNVRSYNLDRIAKLIRCKKAGDCGSRQETVVILTSVNFGNAYTGATSGEVIWAKSIDAAFLELGYTVLYAYGHMETLTIWLAISDMVSRIVIEASQMEACITRSKGDTGTLLHDDFGGWQNHRIGCIKRKGYEEGIPIWKMHAMHSWPGSRHLLGMNFTISIEPWKDLGVSENYYIGYSIEERCMAIPYTGEKLHRGLVLGKLERYFSKEHNNFYQHLETTANKMPREAGSDGVEQPFKVVAVAGAPGSALDEPGVENLGAMPMKQWYQEVAKSKILIGLGDPPQSPSGYDAMCLGVPFMNVVKSWDSSDPTDKRKWVLQQPALRDVPEPYVYHVFRDNVTQLEAAWKSAIENPIERYVLPRLTAQSMRQRCQTFLHEDWEGEARAKLPDITTHPDLLM